MGKAFSEPTLIKIASGFEHATQARRQPQFFPTLPFGGGGGEHDRDRTRHGDSERGDMPKRIERRHRRL